MKESLSIDNYILQHIDPEEEYLKRLYRETHVKILNPHMASGHLQGCVLKMLTQMIAPQRVLEIGTYTGYSALCIAAGLPAGGVLHTIERNDELEDFTRPWIEGSPQAPKIVLHFGNALTLAPTLGETFDMVFIDGDKCEYRAYYEMLFPLVAPHGYMVADNTLWDGHVIDPAYDRDGQTLGIRDFNDTVASDTRVEKVILPLRDGLTLIRKK